MVQSNKNCLVTGASRGIGPTTSFWHLLDGACIGFTPAAPPGQPNLSSRVIHSNGAAPRNKGRPGKSRINLLARKVDPCVGKQLDCSCPRGISKAATIRESHRKDFDIALQRMCEVRFLWAATPPILIERLEHIVSLRSELRRMGTHLDSPSILATPRPRPLETLVKNWLHSWPRGIR